MGLTRIQRAKQTQLALARASRHGQGSSADSSINSDDICDWDGTVNHYLSENSDDEWTDSDNDSDSDCGDADDLDIACDLCGPDLLRSMQAEALLELPYLLEAESEQEKKEATPYSTIMDTKSKKEWKKAEAKRSFGYNGLSDRTQRLHAQQARAKEEKDAATRKGYVMRT